MESHRFDDLIRALSGTRRAVLSGALALATGCLIAPASDAKKKRKHKHKKRKPKAKPNEYGCLEVGAPCTTVNQCCSGICDGKKCRAHDTGTCDQEADGVCETGNPFTAVCDGDICYCLRTTAGSKFCGSIDTVPFSCVDCQRDADCAALGFPAGSACVPLGGDYACAVMCEGKTACLAPCSYEPPEP